MALRLTQARLRPSSYDFIVRKELLSYVTSEPVILKCECGGNVSTEAKQCPHCGKPGPFRPLPPPSPNYLLIWTVSLAVTLGGLWVLLKLFN